MLTIFYSLPFFLSLFSLSSFGSEIKFHTLDISEYDQLSPCINLTTSTTGSSSSPTTTTVEIVHVKTVCGHRSATSWSSLAEEILHADRQRVKSIQDKFKHTHIPVQSREQLYDTSQYLVRLALGTPEKDVHLILDTGSFLTWTQCKPCIRCYIQRDRIFDPRESTSYSNVTCTDPLCTHTPSKCKNKATCGYGILYGDSSYMIGNLAKEKLTITQNDVFPNFTFGCAHNNTGSFGKAAGLLGLSRGNLSIVSQTKQRYGQYFSYLLPSAAADLNSKGRLTFGKKDTKEDKNVKFTSLIYDPRNPFFYFIKIVYITVGKTRLRIRPSVFKQNNTIIDSGTTITRLPQEAYVAMRDEFKRQMNTKRYQIAPAFSILDTCFHVNNGTSLVVFPTVSFTFDGNVTVDLDPSGVVLVIDSSLVCLGFANNTNNLGDDFIIFGNTQQNNIEVVYDVAGGKLGFRHPAAAV